MGWGINRIVSDYEWSLLELLLKKASLQYQSDLKKTLLVQPMNDEGMRGLYLFPNGMSDKNRKFGKQVSEYQFEDEDGIRIIASLYLDENGKLYELDIWKTDFSPIIKFPKK